MSATYKLEAEVEPAGSTRWIVTRWAERMDIEPRDDDAAGPTIGGFGKHVTAHRSERAARAAAARWIERLEL